LKDQDKNIMAINKEQISQQIKENIAEGKTTHHLRKILLNEYLCEKIKSKLKLNVELICNKCCTECEKRDGELMLLETALVHQPLPQVNCKRHTTGCICCYAVQGIRDERGRIVFK
jgi:hypothetical protein